MPDIPISLLRPLVQGYILLFVIMIGALYVIFRPYRTAKRMKEEREAEQMADLLALKLESLRRKTGR